MTAPIRTANDPLDGLAPDSGLQRNDVTAPREPTREEALAAVKTLLEWIGVDPMAEGTRDTPRRVVDSLRDMTRGLREDPAAVLSQDFEVGGYDELITLREVTYESICEHHLLPFTGTATIAYIPQNRVVGISKLARLLDVFARRPQMQERMTVEIAEAIEEHLQPLGVGVIVRGVHMCMCMRGVRKPGAELVTSCVRGLLRDNASLRAEFMALK